MDISVCCLIKVFTFKAILYYFYIYSSSFHSCILCVYQYIYVIEWKQMMFNSHLLFLTCFHFKLSDIPKFSLILYSLGLCEVDHQNKAGYTAIMLAALTAAESPEDMEVAQQLLRMGTINARASQVHTARQHNILYCKNTQFCYSCRSTYICYSRQLRFFLLLHTSQGRQH